ncbi:MAG: DUF6968 family protein [Pseudolabrys sp.]
MIFLERVLKLNGETEPVDLSIRIHKPIEDQESWKCDYEIGWPGGQRKGHAMGVDAIQSLWLAMQKIGAELYTSEAHRSGNLKWLKRGDGYGFPLPSGIRDLYEGNDRLQ